MKLNLGCGNLKLEGYTNIDIDPVIGPDQVFDFTGRWPYKDESIDEIVCYHTIEHIVKAKHDNIYGECFRTLKPDGKLVLTFPEFLECVKNWETNLRGQRDFWEATIFGRQASPHDYHVSLMNRELVARQLINNGFRIQFKGPEPVENFNSLVIAVKDSRYTYEEALATAVGFEYANKR